jgi:hypothetical protein
MDKKQLERKLIEFKALCNRKGYPLDEMGLMEAFPGVSNTSHTLLVKASWSESLGYVASLKILIDVLWEVFDIESRKKVFAIKILDKDENMNALSLQKERYA